MTNEQIEQVAQRISEVPKSLLVAMWLCSWAACLLFSPPDWFDNAGDKYFITAFMATGGWMLMIWWAWPKDGAGAIGDERKSKDKILLLGPQSIDRVVALEQEIAAKNQWVISSRWLVSEELRQVITEEWDGDQVDKLGSEGYMFGVTQGYNPWLFGMVFWDNQKNRQVIVWHKVVLVRGADLVRWRLGELTEAELMGEFSQEPLKV